MGYKLLKKYLLTTLKFTYILKDLGHLIKAESEARRSKPPPRFPEEIEKSRNKILAAGTAAASKAS